MFKKRTNPRIPNSSKHVQKVPNKTNQSTKNPKKTKCSQNTEKT
jgi:hypothetical protein